MAATDGIITGSGNVIGGDTINFALINCKDMVTDSRHSEKTFVGNGMLTPPTWTAGSSSAPIFITGTYGTYVIDSSLGDVTSIWDLIPLDNSAMEIVFIVAVGGHGLVISTEFNTETINGKALPYTITTKTNDIIKIWTDGLIFYIKSRESEQTYANQFLTMGG